MKIAAPGEASSGAEVLTWEELIMSSSAMTLLLPPLVGILAATSEWPQRTALERHHQGRGPRRGEGRGDGLRRRAAGVTAGYGGHRDTATARTKTTPSSPAGRSMVASQVEPCTGNEPTEAHE